MFQHTAAQRRLHIADFGRALSLAVSTHSRAEAAAEIVRVRTPTYTVSTHSRAEAAAQETMFAAKPAAEFQHTAAQRRLLTGFLPHIFSMGKFQHTAAQRRLLVRSRIKFRSISVSTHSRAEAAAIRSINDGNVYLCFNTQPRRGGCLRFRATYSLFLIVSTHSRAEAAARV